VNWALSPPLHRIGVLRCLPALLVGVILLSGCNPDSRKLTEFSENYLRLHNEQDVDGLLELIAIPPNSPKVRQQVRRALQEETRWPLARLGFVALTTEESNNLGPDFNTTPRWRFVVTHDTEDRFTAVWLAGETPEGLRLLLRAPKKQTIPSPPP
jgi:hypothetical protein